MFPSTSRNFKLEHVASIVFQEKIKSQEKLARKLSLLSAKQRLSSRQVFFVLTDKEIRVKEANTTDLLMMLPFASIIFCAHFHLSGELSNILSIFVRNVTEGGDYQAHFFKCANTPAPAIAELINGAMTNAKQPSRRTSYRNDDHDELNPMSHSMTRDMIDGDNWGIGSPPRSPTGPTIQPLRTMPSNNQSPNAFIQMGGPTGRGGGGGGGGGSNPGVVVSHMTSSTDQLARRDVSSSPAISADIGRHLRPSSAGSNSASSPNQSGNAHLLHPRTAQLQHEGMNPSPRTARRLGEMVAKTTNQYTESVLSRSAGGESRSSSDIRKTMKASKIQRDVVRRCMNA
ncbi:PREDICTED: uncharacterized protein LOC105315903, partial [Amphimedon queenslandica]|uniref:PTB domain-containing protein n=1 Tax=Amphimedon queenslandica TaxID=400682 RepID=A0AAN0ITH1_AMPQE